MKKKSLYLLLLLCLPICQLYGQQITTNNVSGPQELIQNLIGSNCASTSNITSQVNGSANNIISYGTFDRASSNFPFQNGVILSTGSINGAGNNSTIDNLSDGNIGWNTDPDVLNVLGIDQTLNATSIEFDFVTANNFIAFRYLFASEEYQQEYPCTFEDVFAILIKRSGTDEPYENIAVVPDSDIEISTNTIRPNINGFCEASNDEYFEGYNVGSTNFNGQTKVLTAETTVVPGETYHIKFVIADHIDERFDSAVFIDGQNFGGSIDLGPDQSVCGTDLILDANINNPLANYTWFLNNSPITGQSNPTLEVNISGTYTVEISIPISEGDCIISDTVEIEVIPFQTTSPIDDISVCDPAPSDGIYDFDFPLLKNDEIFSNLLSDDYTISYHLSEEDALNNANSIQGVYQNTEPIETIFVRIESLDGDCLQIGDFLIIVNETPESFEINVNICNNEIQDLALANLEILDPLVTNFNNANAVTYYLTEEDAMNQIDALSEYPDFTDSPEFMIARVEDMNTGCYALEHVYFTYLSSPNLGIDKFIIDGCMSPDFYLNTGAAIFTYENASLTFNVEEAILEIQSVYPGATVRPLIPIFGDPRLWTITGPTSSLPVGISFEESYCEDVISIEFHKNVVFNTIEEGKMFYSCDASNNGTANFDFSEISSSLRQGINNITFRYFESEEDRENNENELDQLALYTINEPSKELFISSTYNDSCAYDSKIILNINDAPEISSQSVEVCGSNDSDTNTTFVDLNPFFDVVREGLTGVSVTFHITQEDAENGENSIDSIDLSGLFGQVFTRVVNDTTGCFSTSTLDLNVIESLDASSPSPIIACDDNQDGFAIVNLESVLSEFAFDINEYDISFYETYPNALDDRYPISDTENYNSTSQSIYIRIQNAGLDCFVIVELEVFIYTSPVINSIPDYTNCADDPNAPVDFFFENYDDTIINEQEGMQVLYFETENDAINRENIIDKTIAYQNSSNPQTIYVRLENEIENSCFGIAPMRIEVKQAPIYVTPTDMFECQEQPDTFAVVDLNSKISEITFGSPTDLNISFHLTSLEAETNSNPLALNHTTTSSPENIYTRIENISSGCVVIESFNINTLLLPEVNYNQSLIGCVNNSDTNIEWDLTEIELSILDGRQYNTSFTYYNSEEDAENDNNPILNPQSYTNGGVIETLYAKVRNATTNCSTIVPFDLIINFPPPINDFQTYNVCDNETDTINLLDINVVLLENTFNILISYHANEADAEANINPLDTNYTYTNTVETLFARVEYSTTKCYIIYPFQLLVNPLPIAYAPGYLVACDDDFDGLLEFDLSTQDSAILNDQNPNEFSVTYFNSENDAIDNLNILDVDYIAFDSEVIYARMENNITGCFDITEFSIIINPLPIIDIEDQVICLNDLPLIVSADTGNTLDTYLWSTNATSPEIEITEIGSYNVTVTNEYGCENTRTFNVTESESAVIDVVETIDFSDPNNITVTVNGIGDYLYQLNNLPFQSSNVFVNVPIGYNTITIVDQNGCARITREVLVIDTPKHMSPNDDGDFDTWHITGVETLPGTVIYIFDRFGKLLKELRHNTSGWDGIYNGNEMPTGDYWYVADVIQNGKRFQVKGHFALKR